MSYIGSKPADAVLETDDIADGVVTSAKIADGTITTADLSFTPVSNPFRNIIINGDMSIAQRGTSASSITTSGFRTSDRFEVMVESIGTYTITQDTDVPSGQGFSKSLKIDCTTADASPASSDELGIRTKFEGQNLQYLKKGTSSAESLTLSFWVKCSKTGNIQVNLRDLDNSRMISYTATISSANTWEKKTVTFAGDTTGSLDNDNSASFQLEWFLDSGSDYSSGTFSSSWTSFAGANRNVNGTLALADNTVNNFWITGVQLEAGTSASDFEFLPYDVNLNRCLRYFVTFNDSFYPTGGNQSPIGMGFYNNATTGIVCVNTKVPMRAYPSVSISNVSDFDSEPYDDVPTAISIYSQGSSYVPMLTVTTPTRTTGDAYCLVMDTVGGYLHLSSEL